MLNSPNYNLNEDLVKTPHLSHNRQGSKNTSTYPRLSHLIIDCDGCIVWAEQEANQRIKENETIHQVLIQAIHKISTAKKTTERQPQTCQESLIIEHEAQRQNLRLSLTPIPQEGDGPHNKRFLCSLLDLSVTFEKHTQLLQSQHSLHNLKEEMAKLLHELNNPLDSALRYLQLTQAVLEQNRLEKAQEYLQKSLQGLHRIATVSRNMLTANQAPSPWRQHPVPLKTLLLEIVGEIDTQIDTCNIEVCYDIQPNLPCIQPTHLYQICSNIIKNAVDAMPQGGTLQIKAQETQGHNLRLSFCDTGPGIPLEQMPHLFTPFFTTRPQGTGLGLAICQDLLQKINGSITAKSRPDGACFCIEIPLPEIT